VDVASGKLFPGQYFDQETQLHYNYFRDYDASLGRYVQSDPIGINGLLELLGNGFTSQDANLYSYVTNNPLSYIDTYGLAGHKKGKRNSTRETHQEGDSRRARDQGGEKGDNGRDRYRDHKKPKNKEVIRVCRSLLKVCTGACALLCPGGPAGKAACISSCIGGFVYCLGEFGK